LPTGTLLAERSVESKEHQYCAVHDVASETTNRPPIKLNRRSDLAEVPSSIHVHISGCLHHRSGKDN
jgi:hypothetical protein